MGVCVCLRSEVWWRDSEFPPSISHWDDVSWSDLDHHGRRVFVMRLGAVVSWQDLVILWLGKLSARPPYGGCFRLICVAQGGFLGLQEPCLLLISGGIQEYAIYMTRPTLDWVHIVELESNICMLLELVLRQGVMGWPAKWFSLRSVLWLSSTIQLQLMSTCHTTIHSIGAPGYNYCLFFLGYVSIVSSSITKSPTDKKIPKKMCHLFVLVTSMKYRQHFCLVIMVVNANSGEVVWEAQVYAFEAISVNYQMASMLVGEVERNDNCLCCIWIGNGFEDASEEGVRAFPFEMFHRWRVRASSLLVLRFNGRDKLQLSSVKLPKNLRLGSFQPQVHKPIRTLGEPPGYYRRAHDLRPSNTAVVVVRRCSRLIRHQASSAVFTRSPLEQQFELRCMLQSLYRKTSLVEVPHIVLVL
ncbi:hypothetical protein ACQ4PT_029512 [Festuca glaucescens]